MTRREVLFYTVFLVAMGAGWGITQPFTKIAVSTGYGHFGLVLWQMVIGAALMGVICGARRVALPLNIAALRLYLILAMVGTVLPNSISYQAAVFLPAGIMSLLISTVPMFAFVIALALGNDHFRWRRLFGLIFGLTGVLLIVAPAVDLGQDIPVGWAAIYLVTALFYAFEGNYVNKWGTQGLDPCVPGWRGDHDTDDLFHGTVYRSGLADTGRAIGVGRSVGNPCVCLCILCLAGGPGGGRVCSASQLYGYGVWPDLGQPHLG